LSIDASTGAVTLNADPDYETQSQYSFSVVATDAAGNQSEAQSVTLNITDVLELPPMVNPAIVVVEKGQDVSTPIYQAEANIDGATYQIANTSPENSSEGGEVIQPEIVVPSQQALTAHAYVSSSELSEDGTLVVKVSYLSDTLSTGIGLNVHFDSSVLSLSGTSDVNAYGALLIGPSEQGDSNNSDNDAETDSLVGINYVSFAAPWPGTTSPVELATLTFDIAEGATGSSAINFSSSSVPPALTGGFSGQSYEVALSAAPVAQGPELVIDSVAGTVSFDSTPATVGRYSFSVDATDENGQAIMGQSVPVMVVDQVISSESNSYTGTAEADVFALAEGSAQITSGAGEDVFIFAPGGNEADVSGMHNITDFESGADTIDITAAMMAVGYTETDGLTQMMSADMSADILDLINGNDGSLDNMFGASFDNASNLLTVFADTNPEQGMAQVDSYQIELGEDSTFEDDDMAVNFTSFIA
jgi:hypothetical protein